MTEAKKTVAKKVAKPTVAKDKVAKTAKPVIPRAVAESSKKTVDSATDKSAQNDKKVNNSAKYVPRLKKFYTEKFAKELQKELNLANINQVPKLAKIDCSARPRE